ncbi:hypothetical protein DYBT9623_04794 [Dyadobacter sp. CECT 9623]|uniref:Uncharacterized protein n=1 Tax=Dyadobacter linearis TaxID=2823330 RepID=A0ABM8UWQ0_9BACT|nr:hypothetical protein DYBT9623_04794 [Dyadobacter sp. CECT 9623]
MKMAPTFVGAIFISDSITISTAASLAAFRIIK